MTSRFQGQPLVSTQPRPPLHERRAAKAASPDAREESRLDEMVVHDLLNPMTGVLGQLELLEDQLDERLNDNDRQRLEECMASARDLSDMLVNLRCLAQIHSEAVPRRPINLSVQRLFQELQHDSSGSTDVAHRDRPIIGSCRLVRARLCGFTQAQCTY